MRSNWSEKEQLIWNDIQKQFHRKSQVSNILVESNNALASIEF